MVSNDDVGFDVQQSKLIPPKELIHPGLTSDMHHIFTVPANKQWVLKFVSMVRTDDYSIQFYLESSGGIAFILLSEPILHHLYEPTQVLVLDEGWTVNIQYFYNSVTYTAISRILIEERNKY